MRISLPFASALLLFGTGSVEQGRDLPVVCTVPENAPLTCTIEARPAIESGQWLRVRVAIANRGGAELLLVRDLDGSDHQLRYPHCYFEVTGPDGQPSLSDIIRFCGTVNPLRAADFVKVPPSKSFDPFECSDENGRFVSGGRLDASIFKTPGEYRIRFVYSTKSEKISDWDGGGNKSNAALANLLRQVPKLDLRSNEIKVRVEKPKNR